MQIKTFLPTVLCLATATLATSLSAETFNNVTVSQDATIAGAAFFGSVHSEGLPGNPTNIPFPGVKMHVTQGSQEIWNSVLVPGYYQDNWITVEQWGYAPGPGHYEPQYTWGVVSQEYIPPVYDAEGNLIGGDYYQDTYGDVYTGDVWVPGEDTWQIIGTTMENQPIWIDDHYDSTYSYTQYDAPLIRQTATRSDANWVWEVPTLEGEAKAVMRLWEGGLGLLNYEGQMRMSITPTSVYYENGAGSSTQMKADVTTYVTQVTGSGTFEESKTEVRPELVRLTRKEVVNNVMTTGQTQIAAKSASFGGVVTVQGNLIVEGTITASGEPVGSGGTVPGADYLTAEQISSTYLSSAAAASTYLTTQAASATYALKTSVTGLLPADQAALTYLSIGDAAATYVTQVFAETLLPKDEALATYLSKTEAAAAYAPADQVVSPTSLTTTLAAFQRNDQPLVAVHPATFKSSVMLEGERTADPDLPEQDPQESRKIVPTGGPFLVPEQGDISMGEFRAGALPVAEP